MKVTGEVKALTGLRGVGAVWVFLAHLLESLRIGIVNQGGLAVPLFFVLSGFILLYVHKDDFQSFPDGKILHQFFLQRLARIFPLHVFVLLLLLIMVMLLPSFAERYKLGVFSVPNFLASFFLVHTWGLGHFELFRSASGAWNGPAWSLSAELMYYILFPWIAFIFIKGNQRGWSHFQIILCAGLTLLSYGFLIGENGTFTRNMICGIFAFSLGVSASAAMNDIERIPTGFLEFAAIACILIKLIWPEFNTGIFVIGACALIISLARDDSSLATIFASGLIYFLGKISFSIYLIHWPIIQLLNYVQANGILSGEFENLAVRILLIPFVFLLSYFTFLRVEVPSRTALRKLSRDGVQNPM